MKKIFIVFILLVLSVSANAQMIIISEKKTVSSCTIKEDTSSTSENAGRYFGYNSITVAGARYYLYSSFTATQVRLWLYKTGSPTGFNIEGVIFNATGSTELAVSTNTITVQSLTSSPAAYDFQFSGIALSNGTGYIFAARTTNSGSAGNYPNMSYLNTGTYSIYYYDGTWQTSDTSATTKLIIYSGTCP